MLLALQVRNFALIDQLELAFGPGLNVITGETGAGKSMLIDAMELVVGGRAHSDQVRTGTSQAVIDAVFALEGLDDVVATLATDGFDADGGQVILSREVNLSGRNLSRINGRPAATGQIRELSSLVIDIHGQHEHQSLALPARQRQVLDDFGGEPVLRKAADVAARYRLLRDLQQQLQGLSGDARDRTQREDLIKYQLSEIEGAKLTPGEDDQLRRERHILANAERLAAYADSAYVLLYDAGGVQGRLSARDLLGRGLSELEAAAALDRRLEPYAESARTLVYTLDDLAVGVRRYRDEIEGDPRRLEAIQTRLELIAVLKRKYADTVEGVIARAAALREALARLEASEQTALQLESQISATREEMAVLCAELSAARRASAERLAAEVTTELRALGMASVAFLLSIERRNDPAGLDMAGQTVAFGPHGVDEVEMLFSPNPGEPPRRLARAASGGEMSRIMLALKTVLARADRIPVLIFDEVDQGIGGLTAAAVGMRLARLGGTRQVLCVTHLPQIAAFADHHFVVTKETDGLKTRTCISEVLGQSRLAEITRMLGADAGSQVALEHARDLVRRCEYEKRSARAG